MTQTRTVSPAPSSSLTPSPSPAPADPVAEDKDLATQPFGYWGGRAHKAVINHIRDAMARVDVTQPQWWTLNRVDAEGAGHPTREDVITGLAEIADTPYDASRAVDHLLHRGWIAVDTDGRRLHLTEDGRAAKARIKTLVTELRAEIHTGIGDEEYVAALKVLRRMIANVEAAGRRA
ncbi:MarR family winged helix-turn-helix transcriptional regulator [Streptomyces sp. SP18CS02]|uniref:MarR family winged helix-turn-helix transcriptional regulator n=1 Tax=Streptomyces sp. SP18CS02 TaxID=3002531 RepID=UPI002E765AA0|nr:MarR family winged helix-turn-helix transcriptional regulator [Streptomyces sp. SP18CS02]MEE1755707.1 MarR family winged helix-turn-helix transcriptional regulator [Streptomyces sp. SP18CS02]